MPCRFRPYPNIAPTTPVKTIPKGSGQGFEKPRSHRKQTGSTNLSSPPSKLKENGKFFLNSGGFGPQKQNYDAAASQAPGIVVKARD